MKKFILILFFVVSYQVFGATPVAHWQLTESGGTTVYDSVGPNAGTWTGTELITEGTTPPDIDEWGQSPGTQWAVVGNEFVGSGNTANNYLTQDFGAVIGKTYTFSYTVVDNSLVGGTESNQLSMSGDSIFVAKTVSSAAGAHSYIFLALNASHTTDFRWYLAAAATGGTITIDAISVRKHVDSSDRGLLFDGVGDLINCGSDSSIDDIFVGGGTIAWWQRVDGKGAGTYGRVFDKEKWRVYLNNDTTTVWFTQVFTGGDDGLWNLPITAGIWQHIAVVYDNDLGANTPVAYVNGVEVTVSDGGLQPGSDTDTSDAASTLYIGNKDDGTRAWDGAIADVMFYATELSAIDISGLFKTGRYGGIGRNYRRSRY